jgi:hypothetical protein
MPAISLLHFLQCFSDPPGPGGGPLRRGIPRGRSLLDMVVDGSRLKAGFGWLISRARNTRRREDGNQRSELQHLVNEVEEPVMALRPGTRVAVIVTSSRLP